MVWLFILLLLDHYRAFSTGYGRRQHAQAWATPVFKTRAPWCWISQAQTIQVTIIANTMRQRLNTHYQPTRAHLVLFEKRAIQYKFLLHIVLLTRILALWAIIHPTTRSSIRAKYKHPNGPRLEVTFTRCRLILTLNVTTLIETIIISRRTGPVRSQDYHMVLF